MRPRPATAGEGEEGHERSPVLIRGLFPGQLRAADFAGSCFTLDGSGEEPLPKRLSWVKSVQEGAVGFRRT